jgi:hypothetical protein
MHNLEKNITNRRLFINLVAARGFVRSSRSTKKLADISRFFNLVAASSIRQQILFSESFSCGFMLGGGESQRSLIGPWLTREACTRCLD